MIGIEHIWGAVGCAFGTCATVIIMLITIYIEERKKENGK